MALFSQRKGIKPLKKEFQREEIDTELRNRLWSALQLVVWNKHGSGYRPDEEIDLLLNVFWLHFFKLPLDTRPSFKGGFHPEKSAYNFLREFFFTGQWYDVFDFLEFVIKNVPNKEWADELRDFCNSLLEDENSAYRILDNEVAEITDETEIKEIEDALMVKVQPITAHLKRALELLSDKKEPDYRNSIKESISAVEACCQNIVGDSKATLGDALKSIKASVNIHPALEKGFSAIYGYTSDSGGIRHALTDDDKIPSYADAKFMLVACSSFINYLRTKTAEASSRK